MVTVLSLPSMGSFKEGRFKGFFPVQKGLLGIHVILAEPVVQFPGPTPLLHQRILCFWFWGAMGPKSLPFVISSIPLVLGGIRYYPFCRF